MNERQLLLLSFKSPVFKTSSCFFRVFCETLHLLTQDFVSNRVFESQGSFRGENEWNWKILWERHIHITLLPSQQKKHDEDEEGLSWSESQSQEPPVVLSHVFSPSLHVIPFSRNLIHLHTRSLLWLSCSWLSCLFNRDFSSRKKRGSQRRRTYSWQGMNSHLNRVREAKHRWQRMTLSRRRVSSCSFTKQLQNEIHFQKY
jgi:hypothetical protein